jgi:hypothetical protein
MRNVPIELIMLEFANGFQKLAQNPDLSKIISEAYALTDAEKAKAKEAQDIIAAADKIKAELDAREDALKAINDRIAKAESMEAFNEDTLKVISERAKGLDKRDIALVIAEDSVEEARKKVEAEKAALAERVESVKLAERQIEEARADLKRRSVLIAEAATL